MQAVSKHEGAVDGPAAKEPGFGVDHARGHEPDLSSLDVFAGLPAPFRRRMYLFSTARIILSSGFGESHNRSSRFLPITRVALVLSVFFFLVFLMFSGTDLIVQLCDGDQARAVSTLSMISSAEVGGGPVLKH